MSDTPAADRVTFVTIDEGRDGQRLDNFLITHLKGVPRSRIYRIIRSGEVRVNKKRAKQTTRLAVDDVVRVPPVRTSESQAPPVVSGGLAERLAALRATAMETKDFSGVDAMKQALIGAGVEVRMSKAGVELVPGPDFDPAKLEQV